MDTQKTCRICDSDLVDYLDLGELYPSAFINGTEDLQKAPLILVQCLKCDLVQLRHTINLDSMYRQYWYRSGLNKSMVSDLEDVVRGVESQIDLSDGDIVVDIGCNDGTLFNFYTKGVFKVGYDPAQNIDNRTNRNCNLFINDYFSAKEYPEGLNKAKVITSIAMFYDLPDPNAFIEDVKKILAADGIWVIQFTDLYSMLKINGFDNICHEHLEYYSLEVLVNLLESHDLRIYDLEYNQVNGGSLRVYVGKHVKWSSVRVLEALVNEYHDLPDLTHDFECNIQRCKDLVLNYLKNNPHKVHVLGASTKGNTLLQYWGIDNNLIDYAAEVNEDKFGLMTVGTFIPIISEQESLELDPDVYMVLPWHFNEFFIDPDKPFMDNDRILLFPLPEPVIYYKDEDGEVGWTYLKNL